MNKSFSLSSIAICTLLSACGGGSSTQSGVSGTVSSPVQTTNSSWKKTQARLGSNASIEIKTYERGFGGSQGMRFVSFFLAIIKGSSGNPVHRQLLIDIDNNPSTGFQFSNELWSRKSGVDYMIEDGRLYKSTSNDSSWSWKYIKEVTAYSNYFKLQLSRQHDFEPLCNKLNVAYLEFDSNWNISDFYPKTNQMEQKTVSYCKTYNKAPVITLNGIREMIVEQNDPLYADPGATASDLEDGDISANIKVTSNVDITTVGNYTINYEVKDSQGLTTKRTRKVNVVPPSTSHGIIVDGKYDDWQTINPLVKETRLYRSGNYKTYLFNATDDADKLYFYASARAGQPATYPHPGSSAIIGENWQIYIDSDNKPDSGYNSFDYLIENGELYKFSGVNPQQWAWKLMPSHVAFARKFDPRNPRIDERGTVEVSLDKSQINHLNNSIHVRFVAPSPDWNLNYVIMPLHNKLSVPYTLRTQVSTNHAPVANNDSLTTYLQHPDTRNFIPVLENDSDPDGDTLTVTHVSKPAHGHSGIISGTGPYSGKVWYTPKPYLYKGSDSFTYTITDSHGHTATATVNIINTADNARPVAVEDAVTTTADTPVYIDVLVNDYDPNAHNPRGIHIVSISQPDYGVATIVHRSCPQSICRRTHVLFDPQGHVGTISFSYTISDGSLTDTASVTVTSTEPNDTQNTSWPDITNDTVSVQKGHSILIDVLANDTDADGDTLILDQVDPGYHGVTVKQNGKVRYTPEPGYIGTDEFWYDVNDGHGHNGAGKVSITVTP